MDVGGLLGNEAIRARLDAAAAQDRFSHSYLICGPDGSGKHTLARMLAECGVSILREKEAPEG